MSRSPIHSILLLMVAAAAPAVAQAPARRAPEAEARLASRLDELCAEIERQREELHVPGLALALVKDGEVVLARGFGLADLEAERPVTPETIFAVGSTTKAFTAALVGMLADEGKLAFDDPIAKHLEWFTPKLDLADGAEGGEAVLTLRDLLCHRWGFTRMGILWAGNAVPRETVLRTAAGAEPWAPFRKEFHYCNVGYLAAGEAAAKAAGTSWEELVSARILAPLGMSSSTTSVAAARQDERLASGYAWREARGKHERLPMRALDAIAPAGAINSNALDMARWVRFQLGRGAFECERLIREETLEATWEPQIDVGGGVKYALGWMVRDWKGHRVLEHGGNIDGFAAQVTLLPDDDLGYVLLANVTATALQQTSIPLVCEALLGERGDEPTAAEASAEDLSDYVGTYVGNFAHFHEADFEVLEKNGRLAVDVPGQMVFELEPPDAEGLRSFALPVGIAVGFERDADGKVVELVIHQQGYAFGLPRKGVELAPEVPLAELERYLGSYRNAEKERELRVLIQNNRLAVDVPGQMVYELRPPDEAGLWQFRITPQIGLAFHVDEATGAVGSFTMHERGEELRFERVADAAAAFGLEELLALRRPDERRRLLEEQGPVRVTARVRLASAGLDATSTILVDGPERHRTDVDFGRFGRMTTAVDGDGGWSESTFSPFRRLGGLELDLARVEHPWSLVGDWSRFYDEIHVLRPARHDGRAVHVVRLSREGTPPVRYWVDDETGDVLKSESSTYAEGMGTLPVTAVYSDYREIAGVRRPFRMEITNDASGRSVLEVESIETLESVPPDAFDPPPGDGR